MTERQESSTRYRLLETVRQYAWERLVESKEEEWVRGRHRVFFLSLAESAEPQLTGPEQALWLKQLAAEHDNLSAALEWCLQNKDEDGLRLAGTLWRFWQVRGFYSEGRAYLSKALSPEVTTGRTKIRAKALNGAGILARDQGHYKVARELHEQSLTIKRELGDKRVVAVSLGSFADLARAESQPERAARLWGAAEALRDAIGAPLPPDARQKYERNLAAVHEALGEEAFAAVWAVGRAMTLEQAVEYALGEMPQ